MKKDNDNSDDVTLERDSDLDDSVVAETHQGETIKKLREKLKKVEAEAKEYLDGWQRAKADFINIRKRDEEAKQEFVKFSKEEIVTDLIPVLDSFDLAFSNKEAWQSLPKDWRMGMESIYNQLLTALSSHGVQKLIPKGETFNPKLHEAIEIVQVDDKSEDGKILEVVQPGYTLAGKEVRPPKVKVGHLNK
jgi:molecular chaperone GrpE